MPHQERVAMTDIVIDDNPLITFVLLSTPESARIARWHVRAAFNYHGLDHYADDAEIIASELVTNAIQHADADWTEKIVVSLLRVHNPDSIAVIVTDSSPYPPVKREVSVDSERGRGLQIIEALSPHWEWTPEDGGKAVFAMLETPNTTSGIQSKGNQTGGLA
jgi:anti-sigma regulatory factor (Ser/Thr protein kinase)